MSPLTASFNFTTIPGDVLKRPFIAIGMTAFFLMLPLAITSTDKMVKAAGRQTLGASA